MSYCFYPSERLVVIIDGPNFYGTIKAMGFEIDYRKLLSLFREQSVLLRALYYTTVLEDQGAASVRPLVDWLEYNGFSTVLKPAKEFTDSQGYRRIRGSMGVELTVDAITLAEHVDHIVLFTGDGAFRPLVDYLKTRNCRVSVVSTLSTTPPMVSDELRRAADQFIELTDLEPKIRMNASRPRQRT